MAWRLGSYVALVNPLADEGKERRDLRPYRTFVSASDVVRKHMVGTAVRWGWEPHFNCGGTNFSDLLAAYEAAAVEAGGVTFQSWDTTDTDTYTVIVYDWKDDPYTANGTLWHRVSFTIEAVEPGT